MNLNLAQHCAQQCASRTCNMFSNKNLQHVHHQKNPVKKQEWCGYTYEQIYAFTLLNKACILWFIFVTQTFRPSETFVCTGVLKQKAFENRKQLFWLYLDQEQSELQQTYYLKVGLLSTIVTALNIPLRSSKTHSIYQYLTWDLNHLAFGKGLFFFSSLHFILSMLWSNYYWAQFCANKADTLVGVYYRPPNQDKEADEIFCKQLGEVSPFLALILMEDFDLPDISCKYNTAKRK